jgi:hypothetical protein
VRTYIGTINYNSKICITPIHGQNMILYLMILIIYGLKYIVNDVRDPMMIIAVDILLNSVTINK